MLCLLLYIENIAFRCPAQSSSIQWDGIASYAFDGNMDTDCSRSACVHTAAESDPWLGVDFEISRTVYSFIVTNRGDCCCKYSIKFMPQGKILINARSFIFNHDLSHRLVLLIYAFILLFV